MTFISLVENLGDKNAPLLDPLGGDACLAQFALCYRIGRRSARSDEKAQQMLQQSRQSRTYLNTMDRIRDESTMKTIAGTIYEHLLEIGQVPFIIYYEYYLESNQLEAAISIIGQEIDDLETILGIEHNLALQHKAHLAPIISNQGRWKEAEDLEVQLMETRKRMLGQEHPGRLASKANFGCD